MSAQAGLEALNQIDPKVRAAFAPAEVTRAFLLSELGQVQDARDAYARAIVLTQEPPLRRYLEGKLSALDGT